MSPGPHSMPFGAELEADGRVRFRLWAPDADEIELCLEHGDGERALAMTPLEAGWFELVTDEAAAGSRYRYRVDGDLRVPDPASRFQPDGVNGPSEVVDPARYAWRTQWAGRPWKEAVVYELHVGTFTAGATFAAAAERLAHLAELGVTAIEIMPVATFAGSRNWGYDGVLPYAPHPVYGAPDDLRAFVDAAHAHGLIVLLDVVYNHFGPEGNYLNAYASRFFTDRHATPWGDAINFDGPDARPVRDFFIHNALYWLEEFGLDGLRLDAVHAIVDDSSPDILEELAATVHERFDGARPVHLVLENDDNEARYLRPNGGAHAYAAQWNDDFHHAAHTLVTGEDDGYYVDYAERPREHLARCLSEGFAYQGEPSPFRDGKPRGESSRDLPLTRFIGFLQNHDQVGNRAFGERLTALASPDALRALVSITLLAPAVPALFMGEEFGCRQPFYYFADFEGDLAEAVRNGRRREFDRFERFVGGGGATLPDPMAETTFRASVLDWEATQAPEHAAWLELYRALLALRREAVVPRLPAAPDTSPGLFASTGLGLAWRMRDGARLTLLANLGDEPLPLAAESRPGGEILHAEPAQAAHPDSGLPAWSVVWHLADASR